MDQIKEQQYHHYLRLINIIERLQQENQFTDNKLEKYVDLFNTFIKKDAKMITGISVEQVSH